MFSAYRTVLRAPGAAAFFTAAAVGRVGIAMTGLGLVWLVHAHTGSYATAGLVTGGFAVAEAVAGPQVARLVDRRGQTRVLPPLLGAHAAAVAALVALAGAAAPVWALVAGGVLAGAAIPQLGALSAARWAALLRDADPGRLPTAFSLESVGNAVTYLVGPVLVTAVAATGHPAAGTVLAAVLVLGGGLALAGRRRTAPPPAGRDEGRGQHPRALLGPTFLVLVGVNLAIGAYFGAMSISVAAYSVQAGAPGSAALLYAVSGSGGLLGGWLYGLRRWHAPPTTQLAVAGSGLAVVGAGLALADSPATVGIAVAAAGFAVPPVLVLCSVLAERSVPRSVLTQAFTWLNTASAAGTAGTAGLVGRVVDAHPRHGGFASAAAAAAAVAVLAAGHRARTLRPADHRGSSGREH